MQGEYGEGVREGGIRGGVGVVGGGVSLCRMEVWVYWGVFWRWIGRIWFFLCR